MRFLRPFSAALRPLASGIRLPPLAFRLALIAFCFLAACAKRETAVEAGIRTQTLHLTLDAEPASLDPHVNEILFSEQCVFMALLEGLTAIDERTAKAVPAVAERWDISPDGLVYTFYLRSTARWSNGDPVTAADFAFAFQRILKPEFGALFAYLLYPIRNAEAFNHGKIREFSAVGVAVVDDHTLRLTLEHPTPHLLALAAHQTWFPLHRPTLEKHQAADTRTTSWARPGSFLGNGPFTLVEWRPDVQLIVQKNPLHWDAPRNRLDRIVFGPTSSSEVEELNFRMGQIHVTCSLPKAKIGYYREHEPARLRIEPIFRSSYLQFNTTKAPFNQQKVRRALALAIDRTRLARAVLGDAGRPAEHVTPPDCGGYTTRARVPTDFAAARRLLAEAGFPAGRDLPAVTLQIYGSQKLAEVIQETWRRELGIVCTIDQGEIKAVLQDIQALQYSVGMGGWTADFTDPATFLEVFVTNGKENKTGWGNPDYDRLIAKAAHTLDSARRLEVFQEAEALLLEEAPIAPLLFGSQTYLIHPAVKGWVFAPLGLRRYHHVWLEK